MRKCATKYCRRTLRRGHVCSTCRSRKCRKLNPYRYAYNNAKSHAKERGIPFDISFEDYVKFGIKTKYFIGKDRTVYGLTVDRINDNPENGYYGYRKDNIQILTNYKNVRKYYLQYVVDPRGVPCNFKLESSKIKSMEKDSYERQAILLRKFLGMVGRMRKYQKQFFKNGKMQTDLRYAKEYEAKTDKYLRLLLDEGYQPLYEEEAQQRLIPDEKQKPAA